MPPEFVRIEDYRPFWTASSNFRRNEEWTAFTGLLDGQPAWSDGHVLMLGDPPPTGTPGKRAPRFEEALKKADRETLKEIVPLAVVTLADYKAVVFSDQHIINVQYWRLIHERWPDAIWLGDEHSRTMQGQPMVIRDGDKRVAVLMALNPKDYTTDIIEVLAELALFSPSVRSPAILRRSRK